MLEQPTAEDYAQALAAKSFLHLFQTQPDLIGSAVYNKIVSHLVAGLGNVKYHDAAVWRCSAADMCLRAYVDAMREMLEIPAWSGCRPSSKACRLDWARACAEHCEKQPAPYCPCS